MRTITTVAVLALFATPVLAQNPRTTTRVDTAAAREFMGGVASRGAISVVFWKEDVTNDIYASVATGSTTGSHSTGCATTWGAPVRVDRDTTGANKFTGFQNNTETIYVSGNHVYVFWSDDRLGQSNVFFNRSTDGGATFEATDQRLDDGYAAGANDLRELAVAVSRHPTGNPNLDRIHVLISPDNAGPEELYLTTSLNGGASFGAAVPVSTANGTAVDVDEISICSDLATVHCVWNDNRSGTGEDMWYRRSTDSGATFGAEIRLDVTTPGNFIGGDVSVGCGGSLVSVIWAEDVGPSDDAQVAISTDGGVSFGADKAIGGYTSGVHDVDAPVTVVSGGNIVAVWEDDRTGADEIYQTVSTDSGATFNADATLSTNGGGFPRVSKDGGCVGIAWTGQGFPEVVDVAFSVDGGVTIQNVLTVSGTVGDADFSEISYNPDFQDFVIGWVSDDNAGVNDVYVSGFSCCPASVANRPGGANPASYTASNAILGGTWTVTVDLTTTGHTFAAIYGFSSPQNLLLPSGDRVLINPNTALFLATGLLAGPTASFSTAIPNDPCLCGLTAYTQAVHLGGMPGFRLSNAQDVTAGGF